jgi:hypothetical protein
MNRQSHERYIFHHFRQDVTDGHHSLGIVLVLVLFLIILRTDKFFDPWFGPHKRFQLLILWDIGRHIRNNTLRDLCHNQRESKNWVC